MDANPIPTPASSTPNPTMEEFVRNLHAQLQATQAQFQETQAQNQQLHQALMDLRQKMETTPTSTEVPTSSSVNSSTSSYEKRPKARLPKPESFTGEDLVMYSQFELKLMAKLDIDGESIGSERDKLWYAFNLLDGKAAARIHPWMKIASDSSYGGLFLVSELIGQMRKAFLDPAIQDKALLKLNTLKQGARTLREFLSEFDRLLLEAGGLSWSDSVKKGYLRAAVSYSILQGMVGTAPDASYERYCDQLRLVDDQLDQLKRIAKGRGNGTATVRPDSADRGTSEAMDWEPTEVTVAATQGARPSSNTRTETRKCYGCGQVGHLKRNCKNPAASTAAASTAPTAATAKVEEIVESAKETPSA